MITLIEANVNGPAHTTPGTRYEVHGDTWIDDKGYERRGVPRYVEDKQMRVVDQLPRPSNGIPQKSVPLSPGAAWDADMLELRRHDEVIETRAMQGLPTVDDIAIRDAHLQDIARRMYRLWTDERAS